MTRPAVGVDNTAAQTPRVAAHWFATCFLEVPLKWDLYNWRDDTTSYPLPATRAISSKTRSAITASTKSNTRPRHMLMDV